MWGILLIGSCSEPGFLGACMGGPGLGQGLRVAAAAAAQDKDKLKALGLDPME